MNNQKRNERNEEPIYGIPGSSRTTGSQQQRTTGSQQEPIFISDDDIKIKEESDIIGPTTTETKKRAGGKRTSGIRTTKRSTRQGEKSGDTSTGTTTTGKGKGKGRARQGEKSGDTSTGTTTTATTGKGKGKERARSDSSEHTSSDNSSSSSTNTTSPNRERANVFFKKEKMPNDLRESLRVIKE